MKSIKILAIASVIATLGLSSLFAEETPQDKPMGMYKHHGKKMGHRGEIPMFANLNLTDAQKKSLQDLRQSAKADRKNSMMKRHGDVMASSITANGFDKAKFIQNSTKEFNAMIVQRADHMEKIFAILTPAQKAQLAKNLQETK
ncbi:MAG: Spy/CpxP family protein refolding chaperone [Epsilonproteobacteria bacterium]|nr:Spy/CpxP family protein refolding chaperone [Campylobacterota bacterium]MBD3839409.1 Spy/CpxP family protein refolding chaperone [Campylobacterota bacterium]